jgi:hypothetical protein
MASLLQPPTPSEVLLDRRLTPAERKALADKAREEERLKKQLQEGRYRKLRACPAMREAVRRYRDHLRQRLAERASEEAAAKAAGDGTAGGSSGMGGSRGFQPMFDPASERAMLSMWRVPIDDTRGRQELMYCYGTSEICRHATDALIKVGLVEEQLVHLDSTSALTDALCPVCASSGSGARGGSHQQQQPGGAAGGSLSVAAPDFVPHKRKGKQHDDSLAAYQVGVLSMWFLSCLIAS